MAEPAPLAGCLRRRYAPTQAEIAFPDWPHPETLGKLAAGMRAGDQLRHSNIPPEARQRMSGRASRAVVHDCHIAAHATAVLN